MITNPTEELWAMLARPLDCYRAAESLLGLSSVAVRMMGALILATSPEADLLVDEMPTILRSLAIATTARHERLQGEVRGPVMWSETLTARAASAGDTQVYVCTSQQRAYDTAENRVLLSALAALDRAGRLAERQGLRRRNTHLAQHVRDNAVTARRYSEHRALTGIAPSASRRDLARTRSSKRRSIYSSALGVLSVAAAPITSAHVATLCDRRTGDQHRLVATGINLLRQRGYAVPPLRASGGILTAGPVKYVHDRAGVRTGMCPGLHLGDLVVDLSPLGSADTASRSPSVVDPQASRGAGRPRHHPHTLISGSDELERALDQLGQFLPG